MNKRPGDLDRFEAERLQEAGNPLESLRKQRSGCPPAHVLRAASAGALPETMQSAVTAHISCCGSCRTLQSDLETLPAPEATLQETQRIHDRVRRESRPANAERIRSRPLFRRIAFVGTCLIVGAMIAIILLDKPVQLPEPPAVPWKTDNVPSGPRFPQSMQLEKPAVKMSLALLVWRGPEDYGTHLLKEIAPALDAFRSSNYADAAAHLSGISEKYPGAVEVFFYLGVSRLFLGDYPAATSALERASLLADSSFSADVSWYLAISSQYSGKTDKARGLLEQLCGGSSEYAERACKAFKELDRSANDPHR